MEEVVGIGALTDLVADLVEHCTVDRVEDPKVAVRVTAETQERKKERKSRGNMAILRSMAVEREVLCETSITVGSYSIGREMDFIRVEEFRRKRSLTYVEYPAKKGPIERIQIIFKVSTASII